ncbi:MAG TPA: hypothetical protein VLX92_10520 [Kofleriaceae bacterium]|nr:hypothetical protein [Kofleriaceae bacterium]
MPYEFLSDAWFSKVDELIAAAGDLQIPPAMKAALVNVTVIAPGGETKLVLKEGLFARGHLATAPTSLKLSLELARKILLEADAAAGVQAFLAGEMQVEGDLASLVAMQTVEPSAPQQRLTRQIAAITV